MFIPDPGSEFFPSRIRIKEFKYLNPKKLFLRSRKYDPGSSSRILIFDLPRIPDPQHGYLLSVFRYWKHIAIALKFQMQRKKTRFVSQIKLETKYGTLKGLGSEVR
jgi:hypothetical protein